MKQTVFNMISTAGLIVGLVALSFAMRSDGDTLTQQRLDSAAKRLDGITKANISRDTQLIALHRMMVKNDTTITSFVNGNKQRLNDLSISTSFALQEIVGRMPNLTGAELDSIVRLRLNAVAEELYRQHQEEQAKKEQAKQGQK